MPKVDPNSGEPTSDDPSSDDETRGSKQAGDPALKGATPTGTETTAKVPDPEHSKPSTGD